MVSVAITMTNYYGSNGPFTWIILQGNANILTGGTPYPLREPHGKRRVDGQAQKAPTLSKSTTKAESAIIMDT